MFDFFGLITSDYALLVIVIFLLGTLAGSSTAMMIVELFNARRYKKMCDLFLANELNWKAEFHRKLEQATFDLRVEMSRTLKEMRNIE